MSSKQLSPSWDVLTLEGEVISREAAFSAAPSPSAALFYAAEAQLHVASTASSARQRSVSGSGVSHFNLPPMARGRSNSATDILLHALTRMRLIALQEQARNPIPAALLESVSTIASMDIQAERPSTPSRPSSVNSSRSTLA